MYTNTMKKRFLSIPEVAEKLGVTHETVKNYVKYGALKAKNIGGWQRIDGNTLDALFDSLSEVADMEKNIAGLKKEYYEQRNTRREMLKTIEEDNSLLYLMRRTDLDKSLLQAIAYTVGHGIINDRNMQILLKFICDGSIAEISKEYDLQPERIRQILEKCFMILKHKVTYSDIASENRELKENVNAMSHELKSLKEENDELKAQNSILSGVELPKDSSELTQNDRKLCAFLDKRVYDSRIALRYHGCFRLLGIETFGDLVAHSAYDLLKVRNLGKKGVYNIEEELAVVGLSLGMDTSGIRRKYAIYLAEKQLENKKKEEVKSA